MTDPAGSSSGERSTAVGYLEVLLAGVLWGAAGPMSVALFRLGVSPPSVALLRILIGTASLALLLALLRPSLFRISWKDALLLVGIGGLATGTFQFAYQISTESVGVPATVALLYLAPAFVAAGAGPLLGEWPHRRRILLVGLSVGGVWMTVLGASEAGMPDVRPSVLWGVLTGLGYGAYVLFGRHASPRFGPLTTVFYSSLGGTAVIAGGFLVWGLPLTLPGSPATWGLLLLFGLSTITVATLLFFDALKRIEASRAAIGVTVEPLVAALLAALFLGQTLEPLGWLGIVLLMVGVAGAYAADGTGAPREEGGEERAR